MRFTPILNPSLASLWMSSSGPVRNSHRSGCARYWSAYFFNSSGDEWPRHAQALRAIGFERGAAAVEEASRLIQPGGAGLDRGQRIAQYAALSERKEARLDELSKLFYSDAPRLRFMLRHKDLFARVRKARSEAGLDAARE